MKAEASAEEIDTTVMHKGGFMEALDKRWSDGRIHASGANITAADFAILSFFTSFVINKHLRVTEVGE